MHVTLISGRWKKVENTSTADNWIIPVRLGGGNHTCQPWLSAPFSRLVWTPAKEHNIDLTCTSCLGVCMSNDMLGIWLYPRVIYRCQERTPKITHFSRTSDLNVAPSQEVNFQKTLFPVYHKHASLEILISKSTHLNHSILFYLHTFALYTFLNRRIIL
jgi:hypothetical protein